MIILSELAECLVTVYDELVIVKDGEKIYSCEFDYFDDTHSLDRDIEEGPLAQWASHGVLEVDAYYNGDHMVMVVDLG